MSAPAEGLEPAILARIRALVHGNAGIVISDSKAIMVRARLARRLSATGLADVGAYLDHVEGPACGDELTRLISAMTTNVTSFFREAHHFDAFASDLVPAWKADPGLRSIWSAGCSTGQEPYSIAMVLREAGLDRGAVRILATDIDRAVLDLAAAGRYAPRDVASIPPDLLRRHLVAMDGGWQVGPELRRLVAFRALNLIGHWPFTGSFDAIFCRNVAIYFDPPTRARLWARIVAALRPGGRLFVGHSERLPEALLGGAISYLGQTIYQKVACPDALEASR